MISLVSLHVHGSGRHAMNGEGFLHWLSPGLGLGALSCLGSPGHCGGLEIGDELVFVANDSLGNQSGDCTYEELGFYPGQEFRFQVAAFPDGPFRGNPCHSAEGPVLTSSDWEYRYIVNSGNAGALFLTGVDASHGACRGELGLKVVNVDDSVSEQPLESRIFFTYEPTVHGRTECPPWCGGIIPGAVRKVSRE